MNQFYSKKFGVEICIRGKLTVSLLKNSSCDFRGCENSLQNEILR